MEILNFIITKGSYNCVYIEYEHADGKTEPHELRGANLWPINDKTIKRKAFAWIQSFVSNNYPELIGNYDINLTLKSGKTIRKD